MAEQENTKVIFTDTYKTKELIWNAYEGYVEHYNNHVMYKRFNRIDPIVISGLHKFAEFMYNETVDFFEDFSKQLGKDKDLAKAIFKKDKMTFDDFTFLRRFFAKFMKVSGIKNIIKEKGNPGDSILFNR